MFNSFVNGLVLALPDGQGVWKFHYGVQYKMNHNLWIIRDVIIRLIIMVLKFL